MKTIGPSALSQGLVLALCIAGCGAPLLSRTDQPTIVAETTPTRAATIAPTQSTFLCQTNWPEVYLIVGAERRHIVDMETFLNLGFKPEQVRECAASANLPEGKPLTRLLKGRGEQVFWMENGLRRHIPDMATFRALGYREQDIAIVPDDLLETWAWGQPIPFGLVLSATPSDLSTVSLRDAIKAIHDPFHIDPSKGCYALASPYPEYHAALQKITALLLNDPRAQSLSSLERQALFAQVTGFDGVRFIPGNSGAMLVALKTNRGYTLACGSHHASPDALYVLDAQSNIYDIATEGLVKQTWWVNDRWLALIQLKLDSSSGPTRWVLWHIAQLNGKWQRVIVFEFTPSPYNFGAPPPIRFENGYQTLIADLDYWWADDPCDFNAAFKNNYAHGTWQMRRTYKLGNNTYTQVSSEVLKFPVQRKGTGEPVTVDWKSFCMGGVR